MFVGAPTDRPAGAKVQSFPGEARELEPCNEEVPRSR